MSTDKNFMRCCPACDSDQNLYRSADVRWAPETSSWQTVHTEDGVECTACDWSGDISDTFKADAGE